MACILRLWLAMQTFKVRSSTDVLTDSFEGVVEQAVRLMIANEQSKARTVRMAVKFFGPSI